MHMPVKTKKTSYQTSFPLIAWRRLKHDPPQLHWVLLHAAARGSHIQHDIITPLSVVPWNYTPYLDTLLQVQG